MSIKNARFFILRRFTNGCLKLVREVALALPLIKLIQIMAGNSRLFEVANQAKTPYTAFAEYF